MITRGACAEKCLIRGHAAGLGIGGQRIENRGTQYSFPQESRIKNRGTQYSFPQESRIKNRRIGIGGHNTHFLKNRESRIGGHNTHFLFNERESRGNLGRISQNQNLGTQYSFPLLLKSGDKQLISSHKSASAIGGHHNYILTQSA